MVLLLIRVLPCEVCCAAVHGGHNHSNQLNNLHSHMSNYVPHSCGAGIVKALQCNKIQPIQPTANPSMFDFSAPHRHADATTYPHMWLQSIEDMYIQPYIHKYCSITECDIDPSYCDHLCTTLTHKCCNFWSSECIMNFLKKFHSGGFWKSHHQRTLE
jgi:hypothetical protein